MEVDEEHHDGVTVITPSLPQRSSLLAEAVASVDAQTVPPRAHLIGVDTYGEGPAVIRNRLLRRVTTRWVAFLDDDDVLRPMHLERLRTIGERTGVDVVAPYCAIDGHSIGRQFYNRPYDRDAMRRHGIFPITVVARTQPILDVGGFPEDARYEDWELWNALADRGHRFIVAPTVTWTYRLSRNGRTWG